MGAKSVFLTGASAGIGRATAEALLAAGWEVWGTSRDARRLADIRGLHAVTMDLCDSASIRAGFKTACEAAGAFDVLVNNAGAGAFGPLEHLPPAEIRRQFETLVFGHVDLIQQALPMMRERGAGLILNVTSLAARLPIPFMAPYNAAKAAMSAFCASLELELHGTGVRVIDLQPGDIRTGFNDAMFRGAAEHYEEEARRAWTAVEREMAAAPSAEIVAQEIARLLASPVSVATVGGFFQAKVAATASRWLPRRWLVWVIRRYFGLAPDDHGLKSRRRNLQ